MKPMKREDFSNILEELIAPPRFIKDYCPNGLQVEGADKIKSVAFVVSASLEVIERCIENNIDTIVAHHGVVWNYQNGTITGTYKARIEKLIKNNINLFAYHLPLDVHPKFGNNIALANLLGLREMLYFGPNDGILLCTPDQPEDLQTIEKTITNKMQRQPIVLAGDGRAIDSVAICTGGAGIYFEDVIAQGADCFITGEASEQHYHMAKESGVAYIAAGHHATESYGPQAFGDAVFSKCPDLGIIFLNVHNPI